MTTWVTSDLHFGHKNILKFCKNTRPYRDIEHMQERMISEWNARVCAQDTVYILGDVAFTQPQKAVSIMGRLNGAKILVEGNHDAELLKSHEFRNCFLEVHKYLKLNYGGTEIAMFHYPIAQWDGIHRGHLHLYGHLHGDTSGLEQYRAMDVGVDSTGEVVVGLDWVVQKLKDNKVKKHHA